VEGIIANFLDDSVCLDGELAGRHDFQSKF
jgi:hypothetical protein